MVRLRELMHKSRYGLYISMKQQSGSNNSAVPYLVSPWHVFAFPWRALRIYSICKVNAWLYSKDNKQFVFVLTLNLKPQLCIQDSKKAELRFYMPSRLLAHFSKSTNVWVCNYTLNAVFFFFLKEVCVAAQTLNPPENGHVAHGAPLSIYSDATDDNSAIRLINGLYQPCLITNVIRLWGVSGDFPHSERFI